MKSVLQSVQKIADQAELQSRMNTVLTGLKINAECVSVNTFRHLAFFDIELFPGACVSKIENRCKEIALGVRSKTVPIVKVISESGIVRLQVAMRNADPVTVEELWDNTTFPASMLLPFVIGESERGEKLIVDFAKNPHTLISGGTGSGKSVLLHNLIANSIYLNALGIRRVDLYLVDPKQVEFSNYLEDEFKEHIVDVITTYDETIDLMEFLVSEMENRYSFLAEHGLRSIDECPRALSQIVVIIDEVADLMIQDKRVQRFQKAVIRLAQKARAAGIYLVMATQRPSTDVITGLIKANFPARIACKTASKVDSQVILDYPGAENLMGRGDAILRTMSHDNVRFQVAYSEPRTISKIVQDKYFKAA